MSGAEGGFGGGDRSTLALARSSGTDSVSTNLRAISVFDLDRTLTRHPTYTAFLLYVAARAAPWRLALTPFLPLVMLGYILGLYSRKRLKELEHRLFLGSRLQLPAAERLANRFAEYVARHWIYHEATARLLAERNEGRTTVIASAANSIYLAPLARLLGVEQIVCTLSMTDNGFLFHTISGENCYGPSKCSMLADLLEREGWQRDQTHVRFFSDHASDGPAFAWADEQIAVNPSRRLRREAERRGWAILDWRE